MTAVYKQSSIYGGYTPPPAPEAAVVSRALNAAFKISDTRPAAVMYCVRITVTATIAGGQNGDVVLEVADDEAFTQNVRTIAVQGNGQTYSLAVALQGVQPNTAMVGGVVEAGEWVRLRTVNNFGTPSFSYRSGQETLL